MLSLLLGICLITAEPEKDNSFKVFGAKPKPTPTSVTKECGPDNPDDILKVFGNKGTICNKERCLEFDLDKQPVQRFENEFMVITIEKKQKPVQMLPQQQQPFIYQQPPIMYPMPMMPQGRPMMRGGGG